MNKKTSSLLLIFALLGCQSQSQVSYAQTTRAKPRPRAPRISHIPATQTDVSTGLPVPGVYLNSEGSPLLPILGYDKLKTLDIEIYTMGDPNVRSLLRAALDRKVKIRIVKEPKPLGETCDTFGTTSADADCADQQKLVKDIQDAGGSFVPYNKQALCPNGGGKGGTSCYEHGKIAIANNSIALISTGNFDSSNLCQDSGTQKTCNRDFSLIVNDAVIVKTLENIFSRDLAGQSYDLSQEIDPSLKSILTVSPLSMTPIVDFINTAKDSIDLEAQYLNEPDINAALIDRAKKGVKVSITTASVCAFGKPVPSEALKTTNSYQTFEAAGISAAMFNASNKVNGRNGYMHAKVIVVDGVRAWLGSENGSTTSLTQNREYGLIFDTPASVKKILTVAQADHNSPNSETWQQSLNCEKDHASSSGPTQSPITRRPPKAPKPPKQ